MSEQQHVRADGTVTFLPHRLNRHPVVVRGLTADELWICCGLSGAAGFLAEPILRCGRLRDGLFFRRAALRARQPHSRRNAYNFFSDTFSSATIVAMVSAPSS